MKAPFYMVINGTWYNPDDDVKEEHEKYFIIEAKKRKMQTDEWGKESLKKHAVTPEIKNNFKN